MPELERRAVATLYREMLLDLRVYDLYFERVAFLLQTEPVSFPVHRWVERILEEQRADGGWPHGPCIRGELGRFLSLDWDPRGSDVHATFLAVWALVQYREAEG